MSAAKRSRDDHEAMLENLEHMGGNMNAWEEEFVGSIRARFDAGAELTEKQADTLERLHDRRLG
jgi:hypothetical protein